MYVAQNTSIMNSNDVMKATHLEQIRPNVFFEVDHYMHEYDTRMKVDIQ